MKPVKIHIVYEYGIDLRPHSSSYIRLLRPLTHPNLAASVSVSAGPRYQGEKVDIVIVDRFWRPDISPELAEQLVDDVHRVGARLVFSIDDNLIDLPLEREDFPKARHLQALNIFLERSDWIWVSSDALKERLSFSNPHIIVIPNALDERLIAWGRQPSRYSAFDKKRLVIGYMGTQTHDDDLLMVFPALREIWHRHPDEVEFQIIGGAAEEDTLRKMGEGGLPLRVIQPKLEEQEYPFFLLWFTNRVFWDIAIIPLRDTAFRRCKSDIKFLDYSAIGAAAIISKVHVYEKTVQHSSTGWLAENQVEAWSDALEYMITNHELRKQISINANRYVLTKRLLRNSTNLWVEAINNIL